MLSHGTFYIKYGTQTTLMLALEDVTDAEAPFVGTAPLAVDIWLSKDGGAAANATNAFTAISNGIYTWVITATEAQAARIAVSVYDATASAIFKPIYFVIQTRVALGQLDIDATQIGGNTNAFITTGVGTGVGTYATGASALYNHNLFDQTEGTEPSGAISSTASFKAILQYLKRRFFNKATATSSTVTVLKDDSSTTLQSQSYADDGTTATIGKAS